MMEHKVRQENPMATEFQRGKDGVFSTCDSLLIKSDDERETIAWWKTTQPVTSPKLGSPACSALSNGEAVWEPVIQVRRDNTHYRA